VNISFCGGQRFSSEEICPFKSMVMDTQNSVRRILTVPYAWLDIRTSDLSSVKQILNM
jgi:hypothetical protein